MIPHRQGHEYFHCAEFLFLSPQAHGDGRHEKEENPGQKAEEIAHIGLAKDEKSSQEQPTGQNEKYSNEDICYRRVKVAFEFLFEDSVEVAHYSSFSSLA
jgi:hypothetical protein